MKLGELIKQVREIVPYSPNIPLKGLTSEKCFEDIPIRSNYVNWNFKKVLENDFAFSNVINSKSENSKVSIGLLEKPFKEVITFEWYSVFRVINSEILLPKYLLMWFMRNNFERIVNHFAMGSKIKHFYFEELCNLPIRVPPPQPTRRTSKEILNCWKNN